MSQRSLSRLSVIVTCLVLVICPLTLSARQKEHYRGRKFKPPPPTSQITVMVLRNDNDTPIQNAHVVFQPVIKGKPRGGMELKTNYDGKCVMTVIPIGYTVLIQAISNGYQTYGGLYKVEKPEMTVHIRMKLPGQQYSIYDNHDEADSGSGSGSGNGSAKASGGEGTSAGETKKNNGADSNSSGSESKSTPDQESSGSPQQ